MRAQIEKAAGWINTILILGALVTAGMFYQEIQQRIFKTVDERIEHEQHVESAPNDVDAYKMFQKWDSAQTAQIKNNEDAIKSRKVRDSILMRAVDIIDRNAVTTFQNQKKIDSIIRLWGVYNEEN